MISCMHAFDILGDPVRRRILELLADGEQAAGRDRRRDPARVRHLAAGRLPAPPGAARERLRDGARRQARGGCTRSTPPRCRRSISGSSRTDASGTSGSTRSASRSHAASAARRAATSTPDGKAARHDDRDHDLPRARSPSCDAGRSPPARRGSPCFTRTYDDDDRGSVGCLHGSRAAAPLVRARHG